MDGLHGKKTLFFINSDVPLIGILLHTIRFLLTFEGVHIILNVVTRVHICISSQTTSLTVLIVLQLCTLCDIATVLVCASCFV